MKKTLLLTLLFILIPTLVFSAPADMFVTVAGAGTKDGLTWANAFGQAEFKTDFQGTPEPGDFYYIEEGTYVMTGSFSAGAGGTRTLPISLIGVKSGTTAEPPTSSDWAFGSARPLFDDEENAYAWTMSAYPNVFNIQFLGSSSRVINSGSEGGIFYNVRVQNEGTTTQDGIQTFGSYTRIIYSEIIANGSSGEAVILGRYNILYGCYIHDSNIAVNAGIAGSRIQNNIIDTNTIGINIGTDVNVSITNNTLYNNTTGLSASTGGAIFVVNNIFDENTAPATWTTEQFSNFFDNNSWDGDASANTNVTIGPNSIDTDITLTNPASGDFTLPDSSAAEGIGLQVDTNVGVLGSYGWSAGADQTDTQSGGGGGASSYGFSN